MSEIKLYNNYINGNWIPSISRETLDVYSPSNGEVFAKIQKSGSLDVKQAVEAARLAFDEGTWGNTPAFERGRCLTKLGELILENFEELYKLEALDTGKPLKQAKADIIATARYFEYYGGAADKVHGDNIPFLDGYMVSVIKEPLGVTAHIVPWNYPSQMYGRSLAPALAMGNAVVIKPAEEACLTPIKITELSDMAGFPKGVINLVTGIGEEAGAALSNNKKINFISFTGSPEVGTIIQQAAAKNYIGCVLELGGKSPQILFEDAEIESALPFIVNAIVQNGGQTCSAGSRLLIQESVYSDFISKISRSFSNLRVGSHEMDLNCGPLISKIQLNRVKGFIEKAKQDNIEIIAKGEIDERVPKNGFYVSPTLFGDVPRDNILACEEVFGPVLSVLKFSDEKDAIKLANSTDYGLVAGIWTQNGARQMRMAKAVKSGQVYINSYGAGGGIELPFGGVKKSGHGREKGFEALNEFCSSKTVIFKHG